MPQLPSARLRGEGVGGGGRFGQKASSPNLLLRGGEDFAVRTRTRYYRKVKPRNLSHRAGHIGHPPDG